ncbi:glycolipid transfer protein domain-containing protein 2 [Varanus komodoensis]|uniref:glycolipid transfer protein domain-containing protein 2 n=1 Tax=Varanus komodoensis TaxID=61221 RepID=UPI001CF77AB3|nr:glycolipid transfer protein domain-containing protein 2 [Varanus komodoensis]
MGALARVPPRLWRLLLPAGLFLSLLYFSSRHLHLPLSTCLWGSRPCHWSAERLASTEDPEEPTPACALAKTPEASLQPVPSPQAWGQEFRIERLLNAFSASITPSGQILLREYLRGWGELIRFMDSLGAAFGPIAQETRSKVATMQLHLGGRHGAHYRTVQAMAAFELARGLVGFRSLPPTQPPSGCRTLLRLHRALKWLERFLHRLGSSEAGGPPPSQLCAEAYREALAPHHSWWVRRVAALAFLAMPPRRELLRVLTAREEEREARAALRAAVRSIARVHAATQAEFAAHRMLELP